MILNRKKIRIEWGDCDPAGIVYFPRYFAYLDSCTHALLESIGCRQQDMQQKYQILGFPLVDVNARFMAPSRYDEDVEVESSIVELGRTSFKVRHRIYKGDVLAVEVNETRVCVAVRDETQKLEARPLPIEFAQKFDGNKAVK